MRAFRRHTPVFPEQAGDAAFMRLALRLARRASGQTSPNPMVGAVLTNGGRMIGQGWHRRAGGPHAENEALRDAARRGHPVKGATLFVTLEPCCTHGRTPPCTDAILAAGIRRVIAAATDPNPVHAGRGFRLLEQAGVAVEHGLLADEAVRLNEAFNHWIVTRTPFVTVKAAMTLDGKIATASGESKWITGERARAEGMKLRQQTDAILVGINTILADDPALTVRSVPGFGIRNPKPILRLVLDAKARTPLTARITSDDLAKTHTVIVVAPEAPRQRIKKLSEKVRVLEVPAADGRLDLAWLLKRLGAENVTSLLVEGGGETNAGFLLGGLAQRIVFFYAPKILGGRDARSAVAGEGAVRLEDRLPLHGVEWRKLDGDLMLTARVGGDKHLPEKQPSTE